VTGAERPDPVVSLLARTYSAFNARDAETVLAAMQPDVDWPNGADGGRVVGRAAVREDWARQWGAIDPRVEPRGFAVDPDGRVAVTVQQVVRDLAGLRESVVRHVYTFRDGLIAAMEIRPDRE
jgi:ketosteroid isomerase-like protein